MAYHRLLPSFAPMGLPDVSRPNRRAVSKYTARAGKEDRAINWYPNDTRASDLTA